jgi:SAM-dependent methyltransferase
MVRQLSSRSAGDSHEYWDRQTRPGHRREAPDYYQEHAADLRSLFGRSAPRRVLELCCGSGALYPYLGFENAHYTGVDFSRGMLSEFAKTHPGLTLYRENVATYADEEQYDLILMEFAAQHFKLKQLAQIFCNARGMMHSDSLFVCSTIPWKQARWDFYGKVLSPPYGVRRIPLLRLKAKTMLGIRDRIGSWFNPREINRIAAQAGLVPEYYGCHSYPYRFHVVLRERLSEAV